MGKRTWLLIRGLAHEQEHWGKFREMLQKKYPDDEIFGVDLPGVGVYHKETAPIGLKETLNIVRNNTLGEIRPPYYIISMSFGSMIAIEWAKSHPSDITGIVVMNTSIGKYSHFYNRLQSKTWRSFLKRVTTTDPAEIEKIILSITSSKTEGLDEVVQERVEIHRKRPVTIENILRQLVAAAIYRSDGEPPSVPTLILAGKGDRLCDPSCSKKISNEWNLPLRVHPTAGHDLTLDEPEWVLEEISKWVQQVVTNVAKQVEDSV